MILTTNDSRNEIAMKVAQALLGAGCVKLRSDEPFRLPSGWASPVYMDCRRLISFPAIRREMVDLSIALLKERGCLEGLASIAGAESSGIALAAWLADALELPLVYVRKKPVGQSQIEGLIGPDDKLLLVDDLMAAGHSKENFCKALASCGATVKDVFVIFDYGVFPTQALLAPLDVTVHALATWHDVLTAMRQAGGYAPEVLSEIELFLADPATWSQAHGGIAQSRITH
jgi:orotate phosphoribosyltransferase